MDIKYKVILTDRAQEELDEIYNYISKSFMEATTAQNLIEKIQKSILQLEDIPEGFSIIEQYRDREYKYRKLVINNYVAIYRVDKEQQIVYIVRIVYGGRNYLNEI